MSEQTIDANEEQSTAVVNWEEKLAVYAQEAAKDEAIAGTWLSVKAGRLAIDKTPVAGNTLDCVVIANAYENAWYEGKFDPNNPKPPVCYAINVSEEAMAPHEKAPKPQARSCAECPKNEWGSAADGKVKACKNIRRLALLPQDAVADPEKIKAAEVVYLKLPVLSVKNWSLYVNNVAAEFKRPPFAVVTQISTVPDTKAQFKVTFKTGYKVGDAPLIEALVARHARESETIDFPYQAEATKPETEETDKF